MDCVDDDDSNRSKDSRPGELLHIRRASETCYLSAALFWGGVFAVHSVHTHHIFQGPFYGGGGGGGGMEGWGHNDAQAQDP